MEKKKISFKIVETSIGKLNPSEYNPRKWSVKAEEDLKASIEKYGMVDPIIVNSAKERKNIVIGGHFRLKIAKDLGLKTIPVIYVDIPDVNNEKELNLRLNRNIGDWDYQLLKSFDKEFLLNLGFTEMELNFEEPDAESLANVDIRGDTGNVNEYLIINFENKDEYVNFKKELGLADRLRVIDFKKLLEHFKK